MMLLCFFVCDEFENCNVYRSVGIAIAVHYNISSLCTSKGVHCCMGNMGRYEKFVARKKTAITA